MTRIGLLAVILGLSAAACACQRSQTSSAPAPAEMQRGAPASQSRVPREYLVTLAAGSGEAAVRDVYGRYGIAKIQDLGGNVFLVTLSEDPGLDKLEELRRLDARIQAVQPNFVYRGS